MTCAAGAGESYRDPQDAATWPGGPFWSTRSAFGNPTSDSLRTSVTEGTSSLFMVIFAPADYPQASLEAHVSFARQAIDRHLTDA